jgi:uncharacterized repeat protein (TIGR01451 family)
MFKRIVSNLPFSPALVGQLGFYAKRLRKEDATRRLTLIFVALALVVQSLAVFQPATSANASSQNDMVYGGLNKSLDNFLAPYDLNTKNLKDVMNFAGITRSEISSAQYTSWTIGNKLSWGFVPHFSYAQGEREYNVPGSNGQKATTVYSRPLSLWYSSTTKVTGWVGYSKNIGWFAILEGCGNLVTDITPPEKCTINPQLLASDALCKPCPGNVTLLFSDSKCSPDIIKSKTSTNISQGFADASTVIAKPGDQISFTITIKNDGLKSATIEPEDNIRDILDYATVIDNGGGTIDTKNGVLSWPSFSLDPNDTQTRTFVIKLLDPIPQIAKGTSDLTSYDCKITNTFGNSISIDVACPTVKIVETIATELPKTGPTENVIFACIVLAVAAYFFARTRQLEKEIHLIRKSASIGAI